MRKEKKIGLMNRIGEIHIKTWSWNIPSRSGQINLPDCLFSSARVLPHLQTLQLLEIIFSRRAIPSKILLENNKFSKVFYFSILKEITCCKTNCQSRSSDVNYFTLFFVGRLADKSRKTGVFSVSNHLDEFLLYNFNA